MRMLPVPKALKPLDAVCPMEESRLLVDESRLLAGGSSLRLTWRPKLKVYLLGGG